MSFKDPHVAFERKKKKTKLSTEMHTCNQIYTHKHQLMHPHTYTQTHSIDCVSNVLIQ